MTEAMSRCERLERWASLLEREPAAKLRPFHDLELLPGTEWAELQTTNSPLTVAYADPVLRRAGLGSDRLGDGGAFFGLSRFQAHWVLCSCGYVGTMRATEVARRINRIARRERLLERLRDRWRPVNPLPALARWLAGRWQPAA
jgi:hypothetical protein